MTPKTAFVQSLEVMLIEKKKIKDGKNYMGKLREVEKGSGWGEQSV